MPRPRITVTVRHTGRIYIGLDITSLMILCRVLGSFEVIADTPFLATAQKLLKSDDCQHLIKSINKEISRLQNL